MISASVAGPMPRAAVRVTLRVNRPILLQQHQQIDAGPLELAHQQRPVGLGVIPRPGPHTGIDEQPRHQALVGHIRRQRPDDPRRERPAQAFAHRARRHAQFARDRPCARSSAKAHRQQLLDRIRPAKAAYPV
jgi:hypothetical protein